MKQVQLFDRFNVSTTESDEIAIVDSWVQELDGSPKALSYHASYEVAETVLSEMVSLMPHVEVEDTTTDVGVLVPLEDITALVDFLRKQYPDSHLIKKWDNGTVVMLALEENKPVKKSGIMTCSYKD